MSHFDFSTAGEQTPEREYSFPEVADALAARATDVARHLLPGGRLHGTEYIAGDMQGGRGRSLSINVKGQKAGVWKDFATGEGGADFISLWAEKFGLSQGEAKAEAESWLGLSERAVQKEAVGRSSHQPAPTPAPQPVPVDLEDQDWWRDASTPRQRWDYYDARGDIFGHVYRFTHPKTGEKTIRPWNPETKRYETPEGKRPLLYLPEIMASDAPVVLVEGEKCADAVRAIGHLGTTIMGGAQAIGKTDFSQLAGRTVVLWRDNDQAGAAWEEKCLEALRAVNVASAHVIVVPAGKPAKWDAADATETERKALIEAAIGHRPSVSGRPQVKLSEWTLDRFTGAAPARQWLVREVFPLGSPAVMAAMGDVGKGMLTLDMALKIAGMEDQAGDVVHPPQAFGCTIATFGRVVIFSAEDSHDELHRRLQSIDPGGRVRAKAKDRLHIIPLPSLGGAMPLVKSTSRGVELTDDFARIRDQLLSLDDLVLVNFDPLASFVQADLNKDSAAASFAAAAFANLASETGATILCNHHMRKAAGNQGAVQSPEQARDAIRGQSGIVDGVRTAYALWPVGKADSIKTLRSLRDQRKEWRGQVVQGAVVKSNGPSDRSIHTFVRNAVTGLLEDRSTDCRQVYHIDREALADKLATAIGNLAAKGRPLTKSGMGGVYEMRASLPGALKDIGKHSLREMVDKLLSEGRLVTCANGEKQAKWLDVPGGDFARGMGTFESGAAPVGEDDNLGADDDD